MIGNSWRKADFGALARYLERGADGSQTDRVEWWERRNIASGSITAAAREMSEEARRNDVVKRPVYHLEVSFPADERVERPLMIRVADRALADLELSDHQAVIVSHRDKPHQHFHCMVNLVHPWTHLMWDDVMYHFRLQRSLREQERELGLAETPGTLFLLPGQEPPSRARTRGAGEMRREERTGEPSVLQRAREVVPEAVASSLSFAELDARLRDFGFHTRATGRGLVVGNQQGYVPISHAAHAVSLRVLEERFGQRYADYASQLALAERVAGRSFTSPPASSRSPGGAGRPPAGAGFGSGDGGGAGSGTSSGAGRPGAGAASIGSPAPQDPAAPPAAGAGEPASGARDRAVGLGAAAGSGGGPSGEARGAGRAAQPAPGGTRRGPGGADPHPGGRGTPRPADGVPEGAVGAAAPLPPPGGGGDPGTAAGAGPRGRPGARGGAGPGSDGGRAPDPRRRGGGGTPRRGDGGSPVDGRAPARGAGGEDGRSDPQVGPVGEGDGGPRGQGDPRAHLEGASVPDGAVPGGGVPVRGHDHPGDDLDPSGLDPHGGAARGAAGGPGRDGALPEQHRGAAGPDEADQPLEGALQRGAPGRGAEGGEMSPGGPGFAEGRFSVEMSETGEVGIRDRRSGLLYLTTGLEDAGDDVVYLLERAARGDEDEVLRHLTYNDETARRHRRLAPALGALPPQGAGHDPSSVAAVPLRRGDAPDPDPAPRHAASPSLCDQALAQAARWNAAVEAAEAHAAALAAAGALRDLARRVEAAHTALAFARARLADGAGRLFADPATARGRLAEAVSRDGLEPTVARLRTDPALFGVLAPRPSSRFGPWSAASEVARTTGEVSTAIRESISAAVVVDAVAAEVASATRIPDDPSASPHGLAAWLRAAADESLAGIPAAPSPAALQQQTAALRASFARLTAADRDRVARSVPRTRRLLAELQRAPTTPTLDR